MSASPAQGQAAAARAAALKQPGELRQHRADHRRQATPRGGPLQGLSRCRGSMPSPEPDRLSPPAATTPPGADHAAAESRRAGRGAPADNDDQGLE